jgi:hypothetical protein
MMCKRLYVSVRTYPTAGLLRPTWYVVLDNWMASVIFTIFCVYLASRAANSPLAVSLAAWMASLDEHPIMFKLSVEDLAKEMEQESSLGKVAEGFMDCLDALLRCWFEHVAMSMTSLGLTLGTRGTPNIILVDRALRVACTKVVSYWPCGHGVNAISIKIWCKQLELKCGTCTIMNPIHWPITTWISLLILAPTLRPIPTDGCPRNMSWLVPISSGFVANNMPIFSNISIPKQDLPSVKPCAPRCPA